MQKKKKKKTPTFMILVARYRYTPHELSRSYETEATAFNLTLTGFEGQWCPRSD